MDTVHRYSLGEVKQLLAEEARGLESFLSGILDGDPSLKESLSAQLWNGAEPEFECRLESVRFAQSMVWDLSGRDPQAMQLALQMKILPQIGPLDTDGLREYLRSIACLS